jgi:hypothetical protein
MNQYIIIPVFKSLIVIDYLEYIVLCAVIRVIQNKWWVWVALISSEFIKFALLKTPVQLLSELFYILWYISVTSE